MSEDLDIFHDVEAAVQEEFEKDREALLRAGLSVAVHRQWPAFVEAVVSLSDQTTRLEWALDSAFRFFPLVEHPDLGLVLHPLDLATNKVLALIGRAEARDWVDIIECDSRLQPLGYLVWAAAGKDPGLTPGFILEQAARSARYTEIELSQVAFSGSRPSAAILSQRWKAILGEAELVVRTLPAIEIGKVVLDRSLEPLRLTAESLNMTLEKDGARFHPGSLRGAFPKLG